MNNVSNNEKHHSHSSTSSTTSVFFFILFFVAHSLVCWLGLFISPACSLRFFASKYPLCFLPERDELCGHKVRDRAAH